MIADQYEFVAHQPDCHCPVLTRAWWLDILTCDSIELINLTFTSAKQFMRTHLSNQRFSRQGASKAVVLGGISATVVLAIALIGSLVVYPAFSARYKLEETKVRVKNVWESVLSTANQAKAYPAPATVKTRFEGNPDTIDAWGNRIVYRREKGLAEVPPPSEQNNLPTPTKEKARRGRNRCLSFRTYNHPSR
jgi:hypothetical protein